MMRYISLVVFLSLIPVLRLFAADKSDSLKMIYTAVDGYCLADSVLKIEYTIEDESKVKSCELQCSYDGGNNWRAIKQYEGAITKKCTLQVKYPDILPTATDDCYFDYMGKNIYFRVKQVTSSGNIFSYGDYVTFVCKPKISYFVYRTKDDTESSFHICIVPENFQNLNWPRIFEININGKNFDLEKDNNNGVYKVQVKDKDNFTISGAETLICQIQVKNGVIDANLSNDTFQSKIQPDQFTINVATDLPAIPTRLKGIHHGGSGKPITRSGTTNGARIG